MSIESWHEAPIGRGQDRDGFDCGDEDLNRFLRQHARMNHERSASKTFVAVLADKPETILGFYTLSPSSVEFARIPEVARKGLGRYEVGGFRLARLGVSGAAQGRGLGGKLLLAAARRCMRVQGEVGGTLLFVDAKNDRVAKWYAGYGALPMADAPLSLAFQLSTFEATLGPADNY